MGALVLVDDVALDRLAELGLDADLIERVVRQADAEASMCTDLDPPIVVGLTRWGKTSRFLREELVPQGWSYDNPRNLARTINPSGEFAIVAATGDELTGLVGLLPGTRYRKGEATAQAIAANGQLAFDLGDLGQFRVFGDLGAAAEEGTLLTWVLLFYCDEHEFRVELSLPDGIEDGRITSWAERIILPSFPRDEALLTNTRLLTQGMLDIEDDQDDHVVVEVVRR
jgi:hypothetical protein